VRISNRRLLKGRPYFLKQLGLPLQFSDTFHQLLDKFDQPPSVSDDRQHHGFIFAAAMIVRSDGVEFFEGHHITSICDDALGRRSVRTLAQPRGGVPAEL
jgi:hypothetical protein